jgi:hypothetical protein
MTTERSDCDAGTKARRIAMPCRAGRKPTWLRALAAFCSRTRFLLCSWSGSTRGGQDAASLAYGELRLLEVAVALTARPEAPAARRAGFRQEPGGDLELSSAAGPHPQAWHHRALRRARHEDGDGVSDRIVCLNHGRILASGTPAEMQRHLEVSRADRASDPCRKPERNRGRPTAPRQRAQRCHQRRLYTCVLRWLGAFCRP